MILNKMFLCVSSHNNFNFELRRVNASTLTKKTSYNMTRFFKRDNIVNSFYIAVYNFSGVSFNHPYDELF